MSTYFWQVLNDSKSGKDYFPRYMDNLLQQNLNVPEYLTMINPLLWVTPYYPALYYGHKTWKIVTGLFLSNENTIGPAIDLLALVLREASGDRR